MIARYISFAVLSFIVTDASISYGEETFLRVECRKPASGRGCTADNRIYYHSPDGKYIKFGSISEGSVMNYWLKEPRCGKAEPSGFTTKFIKEINDSVPLMTSFCANIHVESGSGMDNIGMVAFVNCKYSFTLNDE